MAGRVVAVGLSLCIACGFLAWAYSKQSWHSGPAKPGAQYPAPASWGERLPPNALHSVSTALKGLARQWPGGTTSEARVVLRGQTALGGQGLQCSAGAAKMSEDAARESFK